MALWMNQKSVSSGSSFITLRSTHAPWSSMMQLEVIRWHSAQFASSFCPLADEPFRDFAELHLPIFPYSYRTIYQLRKVAYLSG